MKRLSILVIAFIAISVSTFANGGYNVLWSLNNRDTFNSVTEFIGATPKQSEELKDIFYSSTMRLQDALVENSNTEAQKALDFNLANAKSILTPEQYRKYLQILNKIYFEKVVSEFQLSLNN